MPDPFDEALDRATNGVQTPAAPEGGQKPTQAAPQHNAPSSAPAAATAPAPAPSGRKFKAKFDHEEKDIDFDEWAKEQWEKGRAKEVVERDYGFDRRLARAKEEAQAEVDAAYREWLAANGLDVVRDEKAPRGWKAVAKQAATPAESADPLAIEEKQLRAKADTDEFTRADLIRLQDVIAARQAKAAEEAAYRRVKQEQEAAIQAQRQREATENGLKWLRGEIGKAIEAHAKSFDGPAADRLKASVAQLAESRFFQPNAKLDDALAIVAEQARILDASREAWTKSLTQDTRPTPPPVVGGVPGSAAGAKKPGHSSADFEAALDAAADWAARNG